MTNVMTLTFQKSTCHLGGGEYSQLICHSRACDIYLDFIDRVLTQKLLNQGYVTSKLQSSLLKFYGRHHDLVNNLQNERRYVFLMSLPHTRFDVSNMAGVLKEAVLLTLPENLSQPPFVVVFFFVCVFLGGSMLFICF